MKARTGYRLEAILPVNEAAIGPLGLIGLRGGAWFVDVHHSAHPQARGGGNRVLSLGCTGHYSALVERFGAVAVGVGGENIVVEGDGETRLEALRETFAIRGTDDEVEAIGARVAIPCLEYTSFLLGLDHVADRSEIEADLAFLDHGRRGVPARCVVHGAARRVRIGDEVRVGA